MKHHKRQLSLLVAGLLLSVGLGLGHTGCTWSELDELEKKTPVRVYAKPKDFTSPTFGQYMIVLERPNEDRLPTIVVGGQYTTPLVALEIGTAGGVKRARVARVAKDQVKPNEDRRGNTVQAVIELSPVGDDARALVGVPEDDYVRWVRIPPADADDPTLISGGMFYVENDNGGISNFGGSLAAGFFDAEGGQQEWAISDDHNIFIVMNESENATDWVKCAIPSPNSAFGSRTRGLVAGRFTAGDTTDTFVAGIPSPNAPFYGAVRFIAWTGIPTCDDQMASPNEGSPEYFGTALAAADLNGDGADDLIVGSPNLNDNPGTVSRVYVYMSTGSPATLDRTPSYSFEGTTLHFGEQVSAVDVNGDGVPELVVGDPKGTFGENYGRAVLFEVAWAHQTNRQDYTEADGTIIGDAATPKKMLGADLKERSTAFGSSIAGLTWWPGQPRRELIIGGAKALYGFYLTGLDEDDEGSAPDHDPRD